jgi:hypothetical protein
MDRLRGSCLTAIIFLSLILPLAAISWMLEAKDLEPRREFSLAAIVLLSLVLPLTASPWLTSKQDRRTYLGTVWIGQSLAAVGGLWVIAAPIYPEYGLVFTALALLGCLTLLRRQMRLARPLRA